MMNSAFLLKIVNGAISKYHGNVSTLEAAIGALFIAHFFGYRSLQIIHSKRTIRIYEKILGLSFKHTFPAVVEGSARLPGLTFALSSSNFWKCVSGDIPVPNRRLIELKK